MGRRRRKGAADTIVLTIENLSKTYGNGVRALNNVSLRIDRGMFGLLGPNGAGKSTLMRTIAALQSPDAGSIQFGDIDVLQNPDDLRRTLGYLPQDFGVYPRISAQDMLDHLAILKGLTNSKARKEVVTELLRQTNLYDVRKKALTGFSGGMRQRFGIAQALLGEPQLIIVDEPTAGLDPEERNRFHNLLSEIGENVVVILSTHIVEDVADLCPSMAIMAHGQIVAHGAPADLVAAMAGKIWRALITKADVPSYRDRYSVISTRFTAGQVSVHVLGDAQPGPEFELVTPDLEDVYFATIKSAAPAGDALDQAA